MYPQKWSDKEILEAVERLGSGTAGQVCYQLDQTPVRPSGVYRRLRNLIKAGLLTRSKENGVYRYSRANNHFQDGVFTCKCGRRYVLREIT